MLVRSLIRNNRICHWVLWHISTAYACLVLCDSTPTFPQVIHFSDVYARTGGHKCRRGRHDYPADSDRGVPHHRGGVVSVWCGVVSVGWCGECGVVVSLWGSVVSVWGGGECVRWCGEWGVVSARGGVLSVGWWWVWWVWWVCVVVWCVCGVVCEIAYRWWGVFGIHIGGKWVCEPQDYVWWVLERVCCVCSTDLPRIPSFF